MKTAISTLATMPFVAARTGLSALSFVLETVAVVRTRRKP